VPALQRHIALAVRRARTAVTVPVAMECASDRTGRASERTGHAEGNAAATRGIPLDRGSSRFGAARPSARRRADETNAGAKKGIDAVQRAATGAKVEDLTTEK